MIVMSMLLAASVGLGAQTPTPSSKPGQQSPCAQAIADALTDGAASEICSGDEAARLANAASKDSAEKTRQLSAAAGHYRRAATLAGKVATKLLALNQLATFYDAQHLDDPRQMETTLRELIALTPDDFTPVYRLAKVQEDQGLIDAAEETLLDARHHQPDAAEPNRMLAQFYARRVTALHKQEAQTEPPAPTNPGEADANGIYRVGGGVTAPPRLDVARYPSDALAAGITGAVVAEIVVDPFGNVSDARVLQSIPLLDEAALQAVRNWHYAPTMVNGQPVPVRLTVTVNFSQTRTPPPQAAPAPPRR
jgi:TonB family protein